MDQRLVVFTITITLLQHKGDATQLSIPSDKERAEKGKSGLEYLEKGHRSSHNPCWEKAVSKLKTSCKDMSDVEQSFLALDFSNCHLQKSGLKTYTCDDTSDFQKCTQKMGSDIIAFNAYTEFFTHVTDACYYLQSEIWRQQTEETISQLGKTSEDTLTRLKLSVEQQQEVLTGQEESIKNQREILLNEKILKDSLLSSAESAKTVFAEVREHAHQQKTMFTETFDNIFQSVDRLANIQTMLLGEFIGLQSVAFYFVATVVCYLFTSTPRTTAGRLPLFVALSVLIIAERLYVGWLVGDRPDEQEITAVSMMFVLGAALCTIPYVV